MSARLGPSAQHWVGTDDLGRDVLSRILYATGTTLALALSAVAIAVALGYTIGLVGSAGSARVRRVIAAGLSLWLAFPPIIVALFMTAVLNASTLSAVIALGLAYAPLFARTMFNLAGGVAERDYVHAARMLGVGRVRRLTRHIAPNVAAPLWIQATVGIGEAMVGLSALSFLGLGVQPPGYDWGSLLAEYLERMFTSPVVTLAPAAAITIVGVMFAFIGEAGALAMDPRRWTATRKPARRPRADAAKVDARPAPVATLEGRRRSEPALLEVDSLCIEFPDADSGEMRKVVSDVTFCVYRGETVGIIGESGSGKTMTASAIAGLVPNPGVVTARSLSLDGTSLTSTGRRAQRIPALKIATVFQNPMAALTPTMTIGRQMTEASRLHLGLSKAQASERAIQALTEVGITGGARVLRMYPHQLSGGMRQRVVIGMGLMTNPELLLADEPTTALDVTIQKQVLELFKELKRTKLMTTLFISHDFGVIREVCDRVIVMLDGRVVEELAVAQLDQASHPYTRKLLDAVPRR